MEFNNIMSKFSNTTEVIEFIYYIKEWNKESANMTPRELREFCKLVIGIYLEANNTL